MHRAFLLVPALPPSAVGSTFMLILQVDETTWQMVRTGEQTSGMNATAWKAFLFKRDTFLSIILKTLCR